jgi:NADPH2:quinone reductase
MNAFIKAATIHTQNMSIPLITGQGRAHHGEILRQAAELADAAKLKPLIDPNRFTFAQANEAHALFESGKHVGKIVLDVEWS